MADWVDFKDVKEAISIEMILAHYGIGLRKVNRYSLRGDCPLPTHSGSATKDSFSVSITKNAWACQSSSCVKARDGRKGGNILDFVAVMEGCTIRDSALKIQDWFHVTASNEKPSGYVPSRDRDRKKKELATEKKDDSVFDVGDTGEKDDGEDNQPLDFTLKSVDADHPYIRQRGITPETAKHFGIGYFHGRGSMENRLVIPIHNEVGELVAYAGRSVDDEVEPKYKLPAGFLKSLVLFNLYRLGLHRKVIVVEGFFGCMKVHQAGFPNVVALMGSELSEHQERLLMDNFDNVVLMFDGDNAGRACTDMVASRLVRDMFVRIVDVPDGTQPDTLSSEEIQKHLAFLAEGGYLP